MLTRRIAVSACALCLAVPTFAAAKPVHHAVAVVVTGDTKNDLHVDAYDQAIVGDTKSDLPRAITHAPPATKPDAPPATKQVILPRGGTVNRTVAGDGSTDGWQIAALLEGGLLAAVAIAAGASVAGRQHRAPRMGV
jgi:hypothetical protein